MYKIVMNVKFRFSKLIDISPLNKNLYLYFCCKTNRFTGLFTDFGQNFVLTEFDSFAMF